MNLLKPKQYCPQNTVNLYALVTNAPLKAQCILNVVAISFNFSNCNETRNHVRVKAEVLDAFGASFIRFTQCVIVVCFSRFLALTSLFPKSILLQFQQDCAMGLDRFAYHVICVFHFVKLKLCQMSRRRSANQKI